MVAGDSGVIIRTVNGGANWEISTTGITGNCAVLLAPASAVYELSSAVIMLLTPLSDSWPHVLCVLLLSAAHLYGIHIFQPLVVYAVGEGGILLRSENGADTWTPNVPLQVTPRTSPMNTLGAY
jgi:hypothetical protein